MSASGESKIKNIRNRFKNSTKEMREGAKDADSLFYSFYMESYNLIVSDHFNKTKLGKDYILNNYLVNCVTSLELYFRSVIVQNKRWDEKGYSKLLNERISLHDAYELFNSDGVTRQYIIAHTNSFQNLDRINNVFSNLMDIDFLKEVENHSVKLDDERDYSLKKKVPDWNRRIRKLYEMRNSFVHEGQLNILTKEMIQSIDESINYFQVSSNDYFESKFSLNMQFYFD